MSNTRTDQPKSLAEFMQDPLGSVIFASCTAMGSLGVVLSSIWLLNTVVG